MKYERIKGREYAIDLLKSISGPLTDHVALRIVLDNMEKAAELKPGEYRLGMLEIIREARALIPHELEWKGDEE